MKAVHPSETAEFGQAIYKSSYEKPGDPPDNRIACANCGWRFNPDTHAEGDTGGDGNTAGVRIDDTVHSFSNTEGSLPQHLRDVATFTASSRTVKDPVVDGNLGCPFCGSTNPRGNLRGDEATWGLINLADR